MEKIVDWKIQQDEKKIMEKWINQTKLLIFCLYFIERLLQNDGYFEVYNN